MFMSRPPLEKPARTKFRKQPEEVVEKQKKKENQKAVAVKRGYDMWSDSEDVGC